MERILFGAGKAGRFIQKKLDGVAYFCDNKLCGQSIDGVRVLSFEELKQALAKKEYDVIVSVIDDVAINEVTDLLKTNGIKFRSLKDLDEAKYIGELDFWQRKYSEESEIFRNDHYETLMLSIAEEKDDSFLKGKTVADFGCGPRGSLSWMKSPSVKIGIDVLAAEYAKNFTDSIVRHGMIYVTSTEQCIPMPDSSVDCIISINALDHVRNLDIMCTELLRILKKGGIFIGSFNLFEEATLCEPQTLTEEILDQRLLQYISMQNYRLAKKETHDTYKWMRNGEYLDKADGSFPCVLWVRGVKK